MSAAQKHSPAVEMFMKTLTEREDADFAKHIIRKLKNANLLSVLDELPMPQVLLLATGDYEMGREDFYFDDTYVPEATRIGTIIVRESGG